MNQETPARRSRFIEGGRDIRVFRLIRNISR